MTPHDEIAQARLERLPLASGLPLVRYGIAIAIVLASTLIRALADPVLPPGYPYVSFFPGVILTAFLFGRGPGLLAAISCGLIAWFFFIPPRHSFALDAGVALSLGFYTLVVTIDIALVHWMQHANRRLARERERSRLLAENRETLFRELQHRVSNNIQMVAALLTLQKREVTDTKAVAALDEAARRLGTIGRLHRQLHDPSGQLMGLGRFLDQICRDVIDGSGHPGIACQVDLEETIVLEPDAAIPVALIVAEAVANAIEHGFAGRERGAIRVSLADRPGGRAMLVIADDGAGLPDGFALESSGSLGLTIAATLARQIGGAFLLGAGASGGAEARLLLPAPPAP